MGTRADMRRHGEIFPKEEKSMIRTATHVVLAGLVTAALFGVGCGAPDESAAHGDSSGNAPLGGNKNEPAALAEALAPLRSLHATNKLDAKSAKDALKTLP